MSEFLDKGKNVRAGEELPFKIIHEWLKQFIPDLNGVAEITQFTGGASNWTYRLKYPNHDLILRRPPSGTKAASAHDMNREFTIQQKLFGHYPVPEMIAICIEPEILGCDFYVMKRVEGIILRSNLPKGLILEKEKVKSLCENMLDNFVKLHQLNLKEVGLENFGKGTGYAKRQINGWSERYKKAKTWNVPSFDYVMDWLKANLPAEERACLIHNDYRFDNLVYNAQNFSIIGVLDWEMATIGDPLMDLGNSLAYWIQADDDFIARSTRRQPTNIQGMLTRKDVVSYYCGKMNFDARNFTFYEVYGVFRLAVIVQQIYYRYYHKQTNNPAFKNFWILVNYLHYRAKKLIKQKN